MVGFPVPLILMAYTYCSVLENSIWYKWNFTKSKLVSIFLCCWGRLLLYLKPTNANLNCYFSMSIYTSCRFMKYSSRISTTKEFKIEVVISFYLFNIVKDNMFENYLCEL